MFATMTIDEANRQLISTLVNIYDDREAASISSLVMEKITGMSGSARLIHKQDAFETSQSDLFQHWLAELSEHRPLQYVLGEAWFAGLRFYVDENVLIPRPETEELAEWALADLQSEASQGLMVLDIGAGSGCISISMAKKRKELQIMACDISLDALAIARKNAVANDVEIGFFSFDIRNISSWEKIPGFNLIISNPPYIPENQKAALDKHVILFEPELALFVPDADPILFYKLIGQFSRQKLLSGGRLFLELHHDFAAKVVNWYRENGFSTELRKDLAGKNRMLRVHL